MNDIMPADGFDAAQSTSEGWGIFTALSDEAIKTDILAVPGNSSFPDEIAAREHVAEQIRAGSDYHADAARFLRRTDIEGYKVFREEHPDCAPITDTDPLF